VNKVCLIAPSVLDHPKAKELIASLVEMGFMVSPSSTRADKLDEEMVELLVRGGLKSITIAPEAGSDKLRELLNKGINEDHTRNAVEIAKEKGIKSLKLYFMIGLPKEDWNDIKAIVELVTSIKGLQISVSINPLAPKPHTPLQWMPYTGDERVDLKELEKKAEFLKKELSKFCDVTVESVERFAIQTILSRGDKDVSRLLELKPSLRLSKKLNLTKYLESIPIDSPLPWDFIDHGYKKERLVKEFIRAIELELVFQLK